MPFKSPENKQTPKPEGSSAWVVCFAEQLFIKITLASSRIVVNVPVGRKLVLHLLVL